MNDSAPIIKLAGSAPETGIQLDPRLDDFEDVPIADFSHDDPEYIEPVEIPRPQVGEKLHFLHAGVAWHRATLTNLEPRMSYRGEEHVVTKYDLENVDRAGATWLDVLHDPDAQIRRWGRVQFAPGPAPVGYTRYDPTNAADRDDERARREAAAAQMSEHERREEMRRVHDELGRPSTSTTINAAEGQR